MKPPRLPRWLTLTLSAFAVAVFVSAGAASPAHAGYYPPDHSDAAYFHDSLEPYGTWHHHATYGPVWHPRGMAHGWRPYTHGRWGWDDAHGWTWVSGFAWGWAPFHYGRWVLDSYYGWIWLPARTWAPAWVVWRYSDTYIGWSPIGVVDNWSGYDPGYGYGGWSFVYRHHFSAPVIYHHVIVVNHYRNIHRHTRHWAPPHHHRHIAHRGFDRDFVERGSRYRVEHVHAKRDEWHGNRHWRDDHRDGRRNAQNQPEWRGDRRDHTSLRDGRPESRIDGRRDHLRQERYGAPRQGELSVDRQRQMQPEPWRQRQAQPPQRLERERLERERQSQPQQWRQREQQERQMQMQAQQHRQQRQVHEPQRQAMPQQWRQREAHVAPRQPQMQMQMPQRRQPPVQEMRPQRTPEPQRRIQQAQQQPQQWRQPPTQQRQVHQQPPRQREAPARTERGGQNRNEMRGGERDGGRGWR